jgi:hypothetical protein
VAGYLEKFVDAHAGPAQRQSRLVSAGRKLYEEAAPPVFREALWSLVDDGNPPKTIAIYSDEPAYPWEIIIPTRDDAARQPLGVEFAVGRWINKEHLPAVPRLKLVDATVIAPLYDDDPLLQAAEEAKYVREQYDGVEVDPPSPGYDEVAEALAECRGTLVHFVGHGETGGQAFRLGNHEALDALDLGGWDAARAAFASRPPLVFINACQAARQKPGLTVPDSLPRAFMELHAGCVIAPIWDVEDAAAHQVATEFYETAVNQPWTPYAEIMRQIRAKAYGPHGGVDTYAAYCFFGDPLARA